VNDIFEPNHIFEHIFTVRLLTVVSTVFSINTVLLLYVSLVCAVMAKVTPSRHGSETIG